MEPKIESVLPISKPESSETKEVKNKELLREKILAAWGSARDQLGAPNNARLAELLYKSLYEQESFEEGEVVDRGNFNREEFLREKIDVTIESKPDKKEFVQAIRRALTSEADFESCLYEGAKETLKFLAEIGHVSIWTTGDVHGFKNEEGSVDQPGSHEQYKRAALSGLGELRREIGRKKAVDNKDVLSMYASEDKMGLVPDVLENIKTRNPKARKIVVLEDRLKNIEEITKKIVQIDPEIEIVPIWVRQGLAKKSIPNEAGLSLEDWMKRANAVDSISQVPDKLTEMGIKKGDEDIAFVVDYDDVISNDEKRKDAQVKSVIEKLLENDWI